MPIREFNERVFSIKKVGVMISASDRFKFSFLNFAVYFVTLHGDIFSHLAYHTKSWLKDIFHCKLPQLILNTKNFDLNYILIFRIFPIPLVFLNRNIHHFLEILSHAMTWLFTQRIHEIISVGVSNLLLVKYYHLFCVTRVHTLSLYFYLLKFNLTMTFISYLKGYRIEVT